LSRGQIPDYHRLTPSPEAAQQLQAFNQRIFDAGLKTQNCDKGFDRFVRKFKQDNEGCAVYFIQEKRCCLLLETTYGLTDEEALWATLASWASFQPRWRRPRVTPGQLFYRAEFSHVFEKSWHPRCYTAHAQKSKHPDFANESTFCQEQMKRFSAALSTMDLSGFEPLVSAEASDKAVQVAEEAVISRLRQIHGGLDFCGVRGDSITGSGALAPGLAQTMFTTKIGTHNDICRCRAVNWTVGRRVVPPPLRGISDK
jgi:hypothetical protein